MSNELLNNIITKIDQSIKYSKKNRVALPENTGLYLNNIELEILLKTVRKRVPELINL